MGVCGSSIQDLPNPDRIDLSHFQEVRYNGKTLVICKNFFAWSRISPPARVWHVHSRYPFILGFTDFSLLMQSGLYLCVWRGVFYMEHSEKLTFSSVLCRGIDCGDITSPYSCIFLVLCISIVQSHWSWWIRYRSCRCEAWPHHGQGHQGYHLCNEASLQGENRYTPSQSRHVMARTRHLDRSLWKTQVQFPLPTVLGLPKWGGSLDRKSVV